MVGPHPVYWSQGLTVSGFSSSSNGLINVHDIRHLSEPTASVLVHPAGTSWASFQAHSGLMSTVSVLNPDSISRTSPSNQAGPSSLPEQAPYANFGLYRSTGSVLSSVTEERMTFAQQGSDVSAHGYKPYTVLHPLRPFLAVGYGRTCFLRGAGVGKGDDTDSGSYSFLKAQAKFVE